MMEFASNGKYEEMLKSKDTVDVNKALRTDSKYRSFKQIVNELYSEEMKEIEDFSVESVGDIAYLMKNKFALKN